ncbi:NlpC/P60 family protein [Allorhizobium pseudoryzae]|uniref:NlpC/P60 family protein n=1 Tax=Allorhizobium pseudoryzae TaxID=379684 RepID=UPI003D05B49A
MTREATIDGARVTALAESWIGTPYRHQGATKGVGCDCIGLVRGIWRELYGAEPEAVPPYAPDWAERSGEERLLQAAARLLGPPLVLEAMQPGDLLLFRWRSDCAAKHAGILAGGACFIHAYEQASVIRSALVPSWRRRIAAVHRFPARLTR